MRIDRGRSPDVFERGAAIVKRYAVENDQRVAVAATIEADRVFAFVRRIADVGALDEELCELCKVGGAAHRDLFGGDDLHGVAEFDDTRRKFARLFELAAGDDDHLCIVGSVARIGGGHVGGGERRQRAAGEDEAKEGGTGDGGRHGRIPLLKRIDARLGP